MEILRILRPVFLFSAFVCIFNGQSVVAVDLQCQGVDMKLTEQQMTHMKECAESVGAKDKSELTIEKFPCFAKCIFEHKKLVDEQGKPHKENIINMLSETMPDTIKGALTEGLGKCLDEHAAGVEPDDDTCHTYTELALCVHNNYLEVCKGAASR